MWPQAPSVASFLTTEFLDHPLLTLAFPRLFPEAGMPVSLSAFSSPAGKLILKEDQMSFLERFPDACSGILPELFLQAHIIPATTDLRNIWGQGQNPSPAPCIVFSTQ